MATDLRALKSFDREGVLDRIEGDMDLYRDLLEIFQQEYQAYFDSVSAACVEASPEKLVQSAHAFKSSLGNLGAARCHAIAYTLERAGRHKELSGVTEEINLLRDELELFLQEARKFAAD